jgi:hypothetical protein
MLLRICPVKLSVILDIISFGHEFRLPEVIPFLAELLEEDVHEVEVAAQTTIANMVYIKKQALHLSLLASLMNATSMAAPSGGK